MSAPADPSDRIAEILRELIALSANKEELLFSDRPSDDSSATAENREFGTDDAERNPDHRHQIGESNSA
jgi:hypothetical protein